MATAVPRWRVSRAEDSAVAGPSRIPDSFSPMEPALPALDSHDEDFPTPKLPLTSLNSDAPNSSAARAARLRELLSRVPNDTTPLAKQAELSSSDRDSDLDFPHSAFQEPSQAQESLKDLFSRIWSQHGDTPQKPGRRRRNSVDVSEVESSPRVQRERAKNKGKRRSMSDEETEKVSRPISRVSRKESSDPSEASFVSSQAATFDLLRQRLDSSQNDLMTENPPQLRDPFPTMTNGTEATETPKQLESSQGSLKSISTTPLDSQSLHMSTMSDDPFQSNLLAENSEMQREMNQLDSLDTSHTAQISTPDIRKTPLVRHRANSSTRSFAAPTDASRRHSVELHRSSSRASLKSSGSHDAEALDQKQKELGWNRPRASKSFSKQRHSYSGNASTLHHKSSSMSLASVSSEMSMSSQDSSIDSMASARQRSQGQLSRSGSSMSIRSPPNHVRSRTMSTPSRDSLGAASKGRLELPAPIHSVISRPSSPSPSMLSSDDPVRLDFEHERERNWNSPRPKWGDPSDSRRPVSPMPSIRNRERHNSTPSVSLTRSHASPSNVKEGKQNGLHHSKGPSASPSASLIRHHTSPSLGSPDRILGPSRTSNRSDKSRLPKSSSTSSVSGSSHTPPSSSRRESSSLNRAATEPSLSEKTSKVTKETSPLKGRSIDLSSLSPERPKFASRSPANGSLLPVRSSNKQTSLVEKPSTTAKGPTLMVNNLPLGGESNGSSPISDPATPLAQQRRPLSPTLPQAMSLGDDISESSQDASEDIESPQGTLDESRLQRALSIPPSPPPSPPRGNESSNSSILITPPRKDAFESPRLEYQPPSPPVNLPELPGPPSSDEEETATPFRTPAHRARTLPNGHAPRFATQTPRPPGAWSVTPFAKRERSPPAADDEAVEAPSPKMMPKTPRPPGGWMDTPVQSQMRPPSPQTEEENLSGLATPANSFSKAKTLPLQTPAPPGGYVPTPTIRKSILKVRFDGDTVDDGVITTLDATEDGQAFSLEAPLASPLSPRKGGHKRSKSTRLVDGMGRVHSDDVPPQLLKNEGPSGSVRMVDAKGRQIEDPSTEIVLKDAQEKESDDAHYVNRNDALLRMRNGLADLKSGLDALDSSASAIGMDAERAEQLRDISHTARKTRAELSDALTKRGMLRLPFMMKGASLRRSSWLTSIIFAVFHFFLACFIFRFVTISAHEYFITTFYDPFYPDIHTYTTIPEPYRETPAFKMALFREDWQLAVGSLWDDVAIWILHCQKYVWESWGSNGLEYLSSWPPT